jgi:hypothetical protein
MPMPANPTPAYSFNYMPSAQIPAKTAELLFGRVNTCRRGGIDHYRKLDQPKAGRLDGGLQPINL